METIVIDDGSTDRSADLVQRQFPSVRLIRRGRNDGFGVAVNEAMAAMDADWVFLLNNDVVLELGFFRRLLHTLDQYSRDHPGGAVFAIGAKTCDWASLAVNHGGQNARWRKNMIVQEPFDAVETEPTIFYQAGACVMNRRLFLELGGFDHIYYPGYWEDYDISYQACRRRWAVLYDPLAVAYHFGKGTNIWLLGRWRLALAIRRNHLLFNWINLADRGLLLRHLMSLPALILQDDAAPDEPGWWRALLEALKHLPAALRLRRARLHVPGVPDRELLAMDRPR
jgi:GT2 family glycosyltransferase